MTLLELIKNLTIEQLLNLHSVLVEAALAVSLDSDFKSIFKRARATNKGNLKKLYSRLAKADRYEIQAMSDELIGLLPRGINGLQRHV